MPQTDQLVDTLKRALRTQHKTYRDVAEALKLSEASVKRLFSERNLSLKRLDRICALLEIEISDLVRNMNERAQSLSRLSESQEQEIARDIKLLLVTICVLNRWTMPEILHGFNIDQHECIHCLARLDQLGLIDLLPGNRVKLHVSSNFAWRPNGPIQKFFQARIKEDFFRSRFDKDEEELLVINGMLSRSSQAVFQRKLKRLMREFNDLNDADAHLPLDQRFGLTVVLAMRPWGYGVFDGLRKRQKQ